MITLDIRNTHAPQEGIIKEIKAEKCQNILLKLCSYLEGRKLGSIQRYILGIAIENQAFFGTSSILSFTSNPFPAEKKGSLEVWCCTEILELLFSVCLEKMGSIDYCYRKNDGKMKASIFRPQLIRIQVSLKFFRGLKENHLFQLKLVPGLFKELQLDDVRAHNDQLHYLLRTADAIKSVRQLTPYKDNTSVQN